MSKYSFLINSKPMCTRICQQIPAVWGHQEDSIVSQSLCCILCCCNARLEVLRAWQVIKKIMLNLLLSAAYRLWSLLEINFTNFCQRHLHRLNKSLISLGATTVATFFSRSSQAFYWKTKLACGKHKDFLKSILRNKLLKVQLIFLALPSPSA